MKLVLHDRAIKRELQKPWARARVDWYLSDLLRWVRGGYEFTDEQKDRIRQLGSQKMNNTELGKLLYSARWASDADEYADACGKIRADFQEMRRQRDSLLEALESIAGGACCRTPGCGPGDPYCDAMIARSAIAGIATGD